MPDPVHLQLFPSSNNCLAWSADGELAVSAGEYVHILVLSLSLRAYISIYVSPLYLYELSSNTSRHLYRNLLRRHKASKIGQKGSGTSHVFVQTSSPAQNGRRCTRRTARPSR